MASPCAVLPACPPYLPSQLGWDVSDLNFPAPEINEKQLKPDLVSEIHSSHIELFLIDVSNQALHSHMLPGFLMAFG